MQQEHLRDIVSLKYGGTKKHGVDAKILADSIKSFAAASEKISKMSRGVSADVSVRGIEDGSLIVDFIMFGKDAAAVLAPVAGDLTSILSFFKACIEYVKFLNGKPPVTMTRLDGGNVETTNHQGDVHVTNINVHNMTINQNLGEDFEKILRNPISAEEAEFAEIEFNSEEKIHISKDDAKRIKRIKSHDDEYTSTHVSRLKIVKPVLEGNAKWMLSDGNRSFSAKIDDTDFMRRVRQGEESFSSGDVLEVEFETKQYKLNGNLKAEYRVISVINHIRNYETQTTLDL